MAAVTSGITSDPDSQARLQRARARLTSAPNARERNVDTIASLLSVLVALGLAAFVPHPPLPLTAAALLVVVYATALRIEFEVAGGYTVPTVVVLVPMLFLLPAPLVPLCVLAADFLSYLAAVALGRRQLSRLIVAFAQAWPATGCAIVFSLFEPGTVGWEDLPLLMLAFCAYVAFDAITQLGVEHFGNRERLGALLRPAVWIYVVDLLLVPIGLAVAIAANGRPLTVSVLLPLFVLLGMFANERRGRLDQALELSRAYRGTALLLGDVIENDDDYTGSHSRDVVDLALAVGDRLGLSAAQRRRLEFGALLHDVGKIAVPKEILHKPGRLTEAEWAVMRRHTVDGQRMLESVGGVLAEVGHVVRCSHEHYDGRGYPDGLEGEDIPIEARICTACDAFSAMTTDRPYRRALSHDAALAELATNAGTQFDPDVVEALVAIVGRSPAASSD